MGVSIGEAGTIVGGVTVLAGIGGTVLGGYLADKMKMRTKNAYLAVCGLSIIPALTGTIIMLFFTRK